MSEKCRGYDEAVTKLQDSDALSLFEVGKAALPGCTWVGDDLEVVTLTGFLHGVDLWRLQDGRVHAMAMGRGTTGTAAHVAKWLRAQITARRDALSKALGE